ncbi:MAG: (d)CMP kinase [Elusimicrobia bacterium]|nr:(d)CMP kinase [Elusimicrobiota bacterium]
MGKRPKGIIVAIDGPAGVGKSTVGRMVAVRLNYSFISTGKMYRALAWKALNSGADLENEAALMKTALGTRWEFRAAGGPEPQLCVDGRSLGAEITDETVGKATSAISRFAAVRKFMCEMQRAIGAEGGVVMEGRDIGTNVFPDAEVKVYLDASPRARARRRARQLEGRGLAADSAKILDFIVKRDRQDSQRKNNPLKKADDGHYLDSTDLSIKQVVEEIVRLAKQESK